MFSDERIRRLTLPPNLDFLSAAQAKTVAALLNDLLETKFDPNKIHPQLPSLIAQMGAACATSEDRSRMADELVRWARWYRLPGFWLTYLFQMSMAQQDPVSFAMANFVYAEAQINLNSDLSLSSLENGYLALTRGTVVASELAASYVLRMQTVFNYYRRLYAAIPYDEVNPLTTHLYSRKTWTDLLDVFPELRKPLDESSPADYQKVIDQCVKAGDTYCCVLARRFLGSVYHARNQLDQAIDQFSLALKDADSAGLDSEIGHLRRLHGYALRKSGHLDEAAREFRLAYDHEGHPLFAYWQALAACELGDVYFNQLGGPARLAEKPLQEAMRWYKTGRNIFERQVATCVLPVGRAVEQQMFRSYVDNSIEVAVLAASRDSVAEAEAAGPRYATDVVAEGHAAEALDPVARSRYLHSRAVFEEHLATFNEGDGEAQFRSYLSSLERNREERRLYVHTRLQLVPTITGAQLSDDTVARFFDLKLPAVVFLLFHIARQETYSWLFFPGVGAPVGRARRSAASWHEVDQVFQGEAERSKSPPSVAKNAATRMRLAIDSILSVYEECFSPLLEPGLASLQGKQLKIFPRFSMNAVPFHALKVKGRALIEYCDVSYCQSIGLFFQVHRDVPSLDPGTLGAVFDKEGTAYAGTFRMLNAAHDQGVYMLPSASWRDVQNGITDLSPSDLLFACHGEFDRSDPAKSHLRLSSGNDVSFSAIFSQLDLSRCRSVTLGACESGIARTLVAAEYVGLPIAFLAAGTQYVIASLWQVNQLASAILLGHHYRFLKDGTHTVVAALNNAQRATMRMSQAQVFDWVNQFLPERANDLAVQVGQMDDPPFAHPYYWAGFYVTGDI